MDLEYVELQAMSNFSFLHGGSHPEEIVTHAHALGYKGIAITDLNSFAGIVRGYSTAKELGIRYIVGTRLLITGNVEGESFELLAYPSSRKAYGKLCALLSKGNLRTKKGSCILFLDEVIEIQSEVYFIAVSPRTLSGGSSSFEEKQSEFLKNLQLFHRQLHDKSALYLALTTYYGNLDFERTERVVEYCKELGIRPLISGDILYHSPERRALQDILTCIREGTEIQKAGFLLSHNAERYLKPLKELKRLYRHFSEALKNSLLFSKHCQFSLEELRYEYPHEVCPEDVLPHDYLRELTLIGAKERYGENIPDKIRKLLEDEFLLIRELHYEHYFLTCYDIVRFARSVGILCQGRGAAANSAVCFCLGITAVDPNKVDLLFARFVSKARNEPPDIDIDFEHERREEVMQYIYNKYGRQRAGLVCNVITYRERSAVREVGKALGLSLPTVEALSSLIHRWNDCKIASEDFIAAKIDPNNKLIRNCFALTSLLIGFPRHLSQHSGGFIICEKLLSETVPLLNSGMESRTIIEWNKDDIEQLGMLKIDILALGMLTAIRKALEMINHSLLREGKKTLELYSIPHDDMKVYDMACIADTVGVFQIESRAQMSMLPRLRPRCFYDLIVEIAIVRPGPIHGNMVHPYLRRRLGIEKVHFPDEKIKAILGKTLGVPLFQEQAMRLAMAVADFTPEEADKLRRAMAAWRSNKGAIEQFRGRITAGMLKNGYAKEFAEVCLEQMRGFSQYGFPESHAASFAHLVYASAWIKCHYPAQFTAALVNSQPMGFYSTSELVRDAIKHGVTVKPVTVMNSAWDCTVNEASELQLGFRIIKGLQEAQAQRLCETRDLCPEFTTIKELYSYAHALKYPLRRDTLASIAKADGFCCLGVQLREALWEIKALPVVTGALDPHLSEGSLPLLPQMSLQQSMFSDYAATGLSLKAHPLSFMRKRLSERHVSLSSDLTTIKPLSTVSIAGLITCRQRPGTAKGTVFLTLEDEIGAINLIVRPHVYETYRTIITSSVAALARGRLQKTAEVIHVIVSHIEPLDSWIDELQGRATPSRSFSY